MYCTLFVGTPHEWWLALKQERQLLTSNFVTDVVGHVLARASASNAGHDAERAELMAQIAKGKVGLQRQCWLG